MLAMALAWAIRELVPAVARRMRAAERLDAAQTKTLADISGGFSAIPNEELATRREVKELRAAVKRMEQRYGAAIERLESSVAELDRVIAVLKDRAGMAG